MRQFFVMMVLFSLTVKCFAVNDVINTVTANTTSHNTVDTASMDSSARDWGLTNKEWARYQLLIQGINGHYYSRLTPPEVLGINAETVEDLKHFAEITAKQEHDKIEKELRFNAAFHAAAKRLYTNEPIVKPFDLTPYTPITTKR